ncbi:hypothetical protein [Rhodococcus spongiicola]|uniref:HNH endonuclease n=1 Tax=Rhodococcus spongiicola TaxID=2487352 RepID=A0A3S3AQT1_9NOCA|nr:hypothetical protein [Rhodococcus spongiicola]RVW06210.1 hypothetical protein EF834_01780 [Rhodococcus spongiicola]
MAFWWATQTTNHEEAIEQGSLWTARNNKGKLKEARRPILEIQPGDIVFHYSNNYLRAVSVATAPWCHADRPKGYPTRPEDDRNDGYLVAVDPIVTGLEIHRERVAELLPHGAPGPLNRVGRVARGKYLSRLKPDEAARLLGMIELNYIPDAGAGKHDPGTEEPATTDARVSATRRLEQARFRAELFEDKSDGCCGLCDRSLPGNLLVAAHIKPRALCTDAERQAFRKVGMLACALGCDALFEHGYVSVDRTGIIVSFARPSHPALSEALDALVGRTCPAHNNDRAEAFSVHHDRSLAKHHYRTLR